MFPFLNKGSSPIVRYTTYGTIVRLSAHDEVCKIEPGLEAFFPEGDLHPSGIAHFQAHGGHVSNLHLRVAAIQSRRMPNLNEPEKTKSAAPNS